MRPLKLIMNAFGPYPGTETIDFTQFQDSSLFLVTGPTGSGKTTIFDALSYALYDDASGNTREKDTFKSQFSRDEDLCYVELEFDLKGKTYFIRRVPKQRGPGKSGKIIDVKPSVEFHHPYGQTTKIMEANNEIEDLMGLTYDQFRQIVMLPQGEFKKMLESNSGDKEPIFRNIFKTENLQDFQQELKEKANELLKEYESFRQSLNQSFSNIQYQESETLDTVIEQADTDRVLEELNKTLKRDKKDLKEKNKIIDQLEKDIQTYGRILEQLDEKEIQLEVLDKLDKSKKDIEELKTKLQTSEKAKKLYELKNQMNETKEQLEKEEANLSKANKELKNLLPAIKQAKQSFEKIKEDYDHLPDKREDLNARKKELDLFETIENYGKKINELNQKIKANEEELKNQQDTAVELEKEKQEVNENLKKVDKWRTESKTVFEKLNSKEKELTDQSRYIEDLEKASKKRKEAVAIQKDLEATKKEYEDYLDVFNEAKESYYNNLAGVLASELVANEPCPVCGSMTHPHTSHKESGEITKEEFDTITDKRNHYYQNYQKESTRFETAGEDLREQLDQLKLKVEDLPKELLKANTELKKGKEEISALERKRDDLNNKVDQENKWRNHLVQVQEKEQEKSNIIERFKVENANAKDRLQEIVKEKQEAQESLNFESKEQVTKEIFNIESDISKVEKTYRDLQNEINNVEKQEVELNKGIELYKQRIDTLSKEEKERREKFESEKTKSELSDGFEDYVLDEVNRESYEKQIENYKGQLAVAKSDLQKAESYLEQVDNLLSKEEYTSKISNMEVELPNLKEERDNLVSVTDQNDKVKAEIEQSHKQSREIEKEVNLYSELSKYANGTKDTGYISFERYVLGIYFDQILEAANHRFSAMTNQRYLLKRKIEKTKGAGPKGLDIDVFDHYTGKERSVNTLSGGETFKASLSLALGLSDVIQNQSGGVSVDTLFIDEGFGTLDSDSLDSAIGTLLDLNKTGRLVGIISHVEELKIRIPSHIEVRKTQTGSKARIKT